MKKLENKNTYYFASYFMVFFISCIVELYFLIVEKTITTAPHKIHEIMQQFFYTFNHSRLAALIIAGLIIATLFNKFGVEKVLSVVFKYRYLIALIIFIILVIFQIHGSSIDYWYHYFPGSKAYTPIIGVSRAIRSDEWATFTPFGLSQYYNQGGAFAYFGETVRGSITDMFILYGQAVRDIAVIFRPFEWGYLFLSKGMGMAFFWVGRTIVLFMVTFEFARIFTKDKKILAASFAILVTWAAGIQWWFAIAPLVEIIIFGELFIVMLYLFLKNDNFPKRIIYSFVMVLCGGGYILAIYTPWQVAFGYVFLAITIAIIIDNFKNAKIKKKDVFLLIGAIALLGVFLIYIFTKSVDAIHLILNTVYPGKRISLGGGGSFGSMMISPTSLFYSSVDYNITKNNFCNISGFIDFFPIGIIISLYLIFIKKNRDKLLMFSLIITFILSTWLLFPWIPFLAKITMFSMVKVSRTYLILGFVNLVILFRAISLINVNIKSMYKIVISLIASISITFIASHAMPNYLTMTMFILSVLILGSAIYFILSSSRRYGQYGLLITSIIIALLAGGIVNPVTKGVDVIYKQDTINVIHSINLDHSGKWIVESPNYTAYPINNMPIMAGAATINSTNVYPDLKRWKVLDPTGKYIKVYNRYAHIGITLIEPNKDTRFALTNTDSFNVHIKSIDLKKLDVLYIMSLRDISKFETNNIKFKLLARPNGYFIYRVNYLK